MSGRSEKRRRASALQSGRSRGQACIVYPLSGLSSARIARRANGRHSMPPARPVDTYVLCYKTPAQKPSFSHSAATATPSPRNGEKNVVKGRIGCIEKRDAPLGKPVASYFERPEVVSRKILTLACWRLPAPASTARTCRSPDGPTTSPPYCSAFRVPSRRAPGRESPCGRTCRPRSPCTSAPANTNRIDFPPGRWPILPRGRDFFRPTAGKNLGFHCGGVNLITDSAALVNYLENWLGPFRNTVVLHRQIRLSHLFS